eukprot:gnl/TRDRNA2_/TRDRNA2_206336_c0_seq1.p1 gnl/TRDRNA2_/TRDRNA2_206336_c0~~gnl/TRDRNA2_/TRDRNA2_206336_c0_seq1.p1  ORF type:complete len:101 (-),score=3.97 gnl/TRDRNA2_/TRDRNA2_206336_c0_seq1:121-423(-)
MVWLEVFVQYAVQDQSALSQAVRGRSGPQPRSMQRTLRISPDRCKLEGHTMSAGCVASSCTNTDLLLTLLLLMLATGIVFTPVKACKQSKRTIGRGILPK